MWGRIVAADGSAFVHKLGKGIHGLDDGRIVASASQVHGFLIGGADFRRDSIEGSADINLNGVELTTDFFIG